MPEPRRPIHHVRAGPGLGGAARGWHSLPMRAFRPLAFLACLAAAPAAADIHAVVVGVDAYRTLPPLGGAANDARDLAETFRRLGAEVELLVDGEATRAAVIAAFERQAAKAGPGDMFVFSYAGHGLQEPEAIPGDEKDGLDETIVFAGFDFTGLAAGERLRDNEIGALLAKVHPGARALVIVDSCHSGTMTRAGDPRGAPLVTRFGGIGRIGEDPLPKPGAETKGLDLSGADNIVFVAAARDEEQIPEVEIDGVPRGALSWTVARAIDGAEGFGGPDMPLSEFSVYVRAQARALSAGRQTPSVTFRSARIGAEAAVIPASARPPNLAAPPASGSMEPDRPALVHPLGAAAEGDPGPGGAWAEAREAADLIWDAEAGELIDLRSADLVATVHDRAALARALTTWRAARRLTGWSARRHAELLIEPDHGRHRLGAYVTLSVARPAEADAWLTIVNLASDGRVQFVFPDVRDVASGADLVRAGEGRQRIGDVEVTHPVGADHVVAILSDERPDALRETLERGGRDAEAFVALLQAEAAQGGHRIGVTPIYTMR
ncbi:MAG: caspase family protein [Pikeienuella sp.]|uniref:caspase family protein n=1 Tax=Pikeienuella sp. TaxID=2831957 RepID=UPI003918CDD8